ncbi:MAG: sigma-70 family RNA polymerase sigma factor [Sciscionella sp.]
MSTVPVDEGPSDEEQGGSSPSDTDLIASVRAGDAEAYSPLYQRHVAAAYNLARQLARSVAEADDLVSEAFAKVLDTLRAGRGPDSAFRAYLLTTLRHNAYDKTRAERRIELSDDVSTVSGVKSDAVTVPFSDPAVAGLERSLAAKAFDRLPERWQAVLWHTEIEGQSPAEVAPLLGLSPNGVSALAYRAREGLRQAYLQVHLAETTAERCRTTVNRLGAWTRSGLSKRETAQVEAHLDECARCRALAAELVDVNGALRGVLPPLLLGAGAAGYLAATSGGAKVGASAAAGVAAGSAASGAGAGSGGTGSSGPQSFIGVGIAAAGIAAAVVIGLVVNTKPASLPTAQPPAATTQAPAKPQPQPQPPGNPPGSPQQTTPPASTPPASPPPAPTPKPATPPEAQGKPKLTTASQTGQLRLVPGGAPQDLRLTVRNSGDGVSRPVVASLRLPPGVRAVDSGKSGTATPHSFRPQSLNAAPEQSGGSAGSGDSAGSAAEVACPAGTGTVRCGTRTGLQPGQSVVLVFTLVADADTSGGVISGTVNADPSVTTTISVPIEVKPKPDGLLLTADQVRYRGYLGAVEVTATNIGDSAHTLRYTVDAAAVQLGADETTLCRHSPWHTACYTAIPLEPGERVRMVLVLIRPSAVARTVHIDAQLGTASESRTVLLDSLAGRTPDRPGPH